MMSCPVHMASLLCLFQVSLSHLVLPFNLWVLSLCKDQILSTSETALALTSAQTQLGRQ